ncbi:hypothetical protein [Microcoleus sp. w1-18aA5]|uniref:hypothetical protein n=1 Tax=Microcoleus sp. w1-18aA5 TaxID=2818982 RepID=UPI002FD6E6D1
MYSENDRPPSLENLRAIAFSTTPHERGEGLPYDTNIQAQIKHSYLVYRAAITKYAAIGGCSVPPSGRCGGIHTDFMAVVADG